MNKGLLAILILAAGGAAAFLLYWRAFHVFSGQEKPTSGA